MNELRLVVPMTPPSGNNYSRARIVTPRGGKPFISWYHTELAESWYDMVAAVASGRKLRGQSLEISYIVFLPTKRKADVDNYAKCIFDALTKAGVIEDDKPVDDFHGHRRHDPVKPRTVIVIKTTQEQMFESGENPNE